VLIPERPAEFTSAHHVLSQLIDVDGCLGHVVSCGKEKWQFLPISCLAGGVYCQP
jgi:hypothetical protein